ncbi:MAG: YneF family protein [Mycoplasmatales bacterium]|nr:YneF family protein [Mycoplasmatales bacterium]
MSVGLGVGLIIGISIIVGLTAAAITFWLTKKMFEKQLRENPPVSEKMIRAMFLQMGRKPSESQIKSVMRSMKAAK